MALHIPPQNLVFPDLITFHMQINPAFPAFAYVNEDAPDTLTEISHLEFGRAAHRIAHALRPARHGPDGEVVMIIANTDTILYHATVAGLSLAGWVPFPVSPRNSVAAVVNMMAKTGCLRIVTLDHAHKDLIGGIRQEAQTSDFVTYELPTLRYAFPVLGGEAASDPFVPYPHAPASTVLDAPALYLHSSGSTGFPKPICHTHAFQTEWLSRAFVRDCIAFAAPRRVAGMALPAFHAFGCIGGLYQPFASLCTCVIYPPRTWDDPLASPVIPTSDSLIEILRKVDCNMFMIVPAFLEQMTLSEEAIEVLKKIGMVFFGGGPLPAKVGDMLCAAGVQLVNAYGGTEFGAPLMVTDKKDNAEGDWAWMRFADDNLKVRWMPQGDDTYELHILVTDEFHLAVENLPDVRGYATSDIFVKHPTKDAWKIVGRVDDVIVLASGEKTVPAPMESIISASPLVQGVTMFGRERHHVGVLIEPREGYAIDVDDENAIAAFRNQIWPVIEEANEPSPAFSRIFKEMILITSKDKPMLRASKGTIQRKATLNAYKAEIDALYGMVEASSSAPGPSAWTSEAIGAWLLAHASAVHSDRDIDPYMDLFVQGFDSLSATQLRNRILGGMRTSPDPEITKVAAHVTPNFVFENPTIQQLGARIVALIHDNGVGIDVVEQHKQAIDAMIEKYSVSLSGPVDGVLSTSPPILPAVVLLTGSTGGLGSFLLSELLQNPAVERVYAFNRRSLAKSIGERQISAFRDRGLALDLLDSTKLVYVEADASLNKCGLSVETYEEIRASVTLIIHNAWRLDFNLALSSFEDSIRASRNLANLGLNSAQKERLRFLFTSSVGSAQGWDKAEEPFPERVQLDSSVAVGAGYGESKYATERILVQSGLHVTSLRIGQIAGGPGGSWSTTDWFPIIVKSSVVLGALPESAGVVSWLREEEVAAALLETAFATEAPPPALNIVNPRHAPWAEMITCVQRALVQRREITLPIVPFGEWMARLERKAENASGDDVATIPAIKLLGFLRSFARQDEIVRKSLAPGTTVMTDVGMPALCTAEAQRVSPMMARMQAIGEVEADAWVGYWISMGFL